jgi:hypothetical protein
MPSSLEKWLSPNEKSPPRYDGVEVDYKGKTVQALHVKELTPNPKTLNRTVVMVD